MLGDGVNVFCCCDAVMIMVHLVVKGINKISANNRFQVMFETLDK